MSKLSVFEITALQAHQNAAFSLAISARKVVADYAFAKAELAADQRHAEFQDWRFKSLMSECKDMSASQIRHPIKLR